MAALPLIRSVGGSSSVPEIRTPSICPSDRCEEFASEDIERRILAGYPSLTHRLAGKLPAPPDGEIAPRSDVLSVGESENVVGWQLTALTIVSGCSFFCVLGFFLPLGRHGFV